MTSAYTAMGRSSGNLGSLEQCIIATAAFNRWRVLTAALALHLVMAYGLGYIPLYQPGSNGFMSDAELRRFRPNRANPALWKSVRLELARAGLDTMAGIAWVLIGIPLACGVWTTVINL